MPTTSHDLHPRRRGASYTYDEVRQIYLTPKSSGNAAALAARFERTPGAIDFAWRWMDADVGCFPAKAFNRLHRLILDVRAELGAETRGQGDGHRTVPTVWKEGA